MFTSQPGKPSWGWQLFRPLLSIVALLLMPLVWGDNGCGQGPVTGFKLLGEHSPIWSSLILAIVCLASILGRRLKPGQALLGHLFAFLGAVYLTLAVGLGYAFLTRNRWPGGVCSLLLLILLIDCSRSLGLGVIALGRALSNESGKPISPLRQILAGALPLVLVMMALLSRECGLFRSHAPRQIPVEPGDVKATLGPPLALPFLATASVDVTPDRNAPLLGKLPISPESEMWRGAVWQGPRGAGFGRHIPLETFLLRGGDWLLVHAESGLWLLESQTLVRRARLHTGAIAAVDVSRDGSRIAYADCPFGANAWQSTCDLVVLRFPELTELHKSEIKFPVQLRFSANGHVLASSAGHYGGVTVTSLESGKEPWQSHVLSTSVAAVPISENRVGYMDDSGRVAIEELGEKEPRYLGAADGPVMDFPFRLGIARSSGEIFYDAAADHLLEPVRRGALVIAAAASDHPQTVKPLTQEEFEATGLRRQHSYQGDDIDRLFQVKSSRYTWNIEAVKGTQSAHGEVVGIDRNYVVRVSHDGVRRSVDFGEGNDRLQVSLSKTDAVFWNMKSDKLMVRRISLTKPAFDQTPELLGSFATEYERGPLLFPSGDRAFLTFDDQKKTSLLRLPRGGTLSAPISLNVTGLQSPSQGAEENGRFAFLNSAGILIEITAEQAHIVTTGVDWTEKLSFDAPSGCWALTQRQQRRLVGENCPQPPALPNPSSPGDRNRSRAKK